MKRLVPLIVLLIIGVSFTVPAFSANCKAPKAPAELSADEIMALYECLRPTFLAGFGKKDDEVGAAYGDWKAASIRPAAPGVHSGQHLMTFINPVGYDQYVKFETNISMPIGTVIAKENFTIKDSGKVKVGALLIMTKVGDEAVDTGGWVYSGIKPNGKKLKVDGKGYCHACHQAYPTQDFLGYPIPEVRVN